MSDSISRRGPDAEGFWIEPRIGMAHRRLSIIDPTRGDQPIGNEDGSIQATFDGDGRFLQIDSDYCSMKDHR